MKTKCINGALGVEVCDVDLNAISDQLRLDLQIVRLTHIMQDEDVLTIIKIKGVSSQ